MKNNNNNNNNIMFFSRLGNNRIPYGRHFWPWSLHRCLFQWILGESIQIHYRGFFSSFFFSSFISLIADGPHHYHPACGHKGSSHLSPVRDASSARRARVQLKFSITYDTCTFPVALHIILYYYDCLRAPITTAAPRARCGNSFRFSRGGYCTLAQMISQLIRPPTAVIRYRRVLGLYLLLYL